MCLVAICHITWDSYIAKEGGGCVCAILRSGKELTPACPAKAHGE